MKPRPIAKIKSNWESKLTQKEATKAALVHALGISPSRLSQLSGNMKFPKPFEFIYDALAHAHVGVYKVAEVKRWIKKNESRIEFVAPPSYENIEEAKIEESDPENICACSVCGKTPKINKGVPVSPGVDHRIKPRVLQTPWYHIKCCGVSTTGRTKAEAAKLWNERNSQK